MKNKQRKQTKPFCLENCKGFILNHSLAELKSSCQGLAILVAILRIVRRKLANSSSCLGVCTGAYVEGVPVTLGTEGTRKAPVFTLSIYGVALMVPRCLCRIPGTDSLDRNET